MRVVTTYTASDGHGTLILARTARLFGRNVRARHILARVGRYSCRLSGLFLFHDLGHDASLSRPVLFSKRNSVMTTKRRFGM